MSNLKERLLSFINYLGLEKSKFEQVTGLSNGFVDKSGDNIRSSSLEKISSQYPQLNKDWLRYGTGEMLKDPIIQDISNYSKSQVKTDSITERLQYIIDEIFEGNKAAFARKIGIAPTSISNYLGKERTSKPSSDILGDIVTFIPNINAKWLLTGEGDAFSNEYSIDYSLKGGKNTQSTTEKEIYYIECIKNLSITSKKNAEANILNAEANNRNSQNLERLIHLLEKK